MHRSTGEYNNNILKHLPKKGNIKVNLQFTEIKHTHTYTCTHARVSARSHTQGMKVGGASWKEGVCQQEKEGNKTG